MGEELISLGSTTKQLLRSMLTPLLVKGSIQFMAF